MDEVIQSTPGGERIVTGVEFNEHEHEKIRDDEEVMRSFGVQNKNAEVGGHC